MASEIDLLVANVFLVVVRDMETQELHFGAKVGDNMAITRRFENAALFTEYDDATEHGRKVAAHLVESAPHMSFRVFAIDYGTVLAIPTALSGVLR